MLIGLSMSKCITDIMEKKINPDDVMLIIGRTDFNLEQIDEMIDQYQSYRGDWYDFDRTELKKLIATLYKDGRIHQPRQFGAYPMPSGRGKHWMRVLYEPQYLSEQAQKAWDRYVLLASLTK